MKDVEFFGAEPLNTLFNSLKILIEYHIFQLASRFYYKVNEGKLYKGTVTLLIAFKLALHYQNSKD